MISYFNPNCIFSVMISAKLVTGTVDMDSIEQEIAAYLKCENGKCSFFRQADYVRLRLAALYSSKVDEPMLAFHGRLKVCLTKDKIVEVHNVEGRLNDEDDQQEEFVYLKQQEVE
jgi:hypothetical protein